MLLVTSKFPWVKKGHGLFESPGSGILAGHHGKEKHLEVFSSCVKFHDTVVSNSWVFPEDVAQNSANPRHYVPGDSSRDLLIP